MNDSWKANAKDFFAPAVERMKKAKRGTVASWLAFAAALFAFVAFAATLPLGAPPVIPSLFGASLVSGIVDKANAAVVFFVFAVALFGCSLAFALPSFKTRRVWSLVIVGVSLLMGVVVTSAMLSRSPAGVAAGAALLGIHLLLLTPVAGLAAATMRWKWRYFTAPALGVLVFIASVLLFVFAGVAGGWVSELDETGAISSWVNDQELLHAVPSFVSFVVIGYAGLSFLRFQGELSEAAPELDFGQIWRRTVAATRRDAKKSGGEQPAVATAPAPEQKKEAAPEEQTPAAEKPTDALPGEKTIAEPPKAEESPKPATEPVKPEEPTPPAQKEASPTQEEAPKPKTEGFAAKTRSLFTGLFNTTGKTKAAAGGQTPQPKNAGATGQSPSTEPSVAQADVPPTVAQLFDNVAPLPPIDVPPPAAPAEPSAKQATKHVAGTHSTGAVSKTRARTKKTAHEEPAAPKAKTKTAAVKPKTKPVDDLPPVAFDDTQIVSEQPKADTPKTDKIEPITHKTVADRLEDLVAKGVLDSVDEPEPEHVDFSGAEKPVQVEPEESDDYDGDDGEEA